MDRTDQSRTCTDAPQVSEVLRPVGIPLTPLRITPRPAPPLRPLTAVPVAWPTDADVDRALGNYGDPDPRQHADRIGQPAAWSAFGEGPDGSAA